MPLLFLLFLALEIYLYVLVGGAIGAGGAIGLVLGAIAIGFAIVRFQGFAMLLRARRTLAEGTQPAGPIIEGAALLIAGLLLIVPGMISDAVGLLLLIPFVRRRLIGVIAKSISARLHGAAWPSGQDKASEDDVIDASYTEVPPEPPSRLDRDQPKPPSSPG
ncbi:MAG: FxsA family protein [Alphaproteobacteria bacterium]